MNAQKGFTLVELAIVMIIIGLLIGGVLKGQELIENAKVKATISDFKAIQAASQTFISTYGGIAGDLANAQTRLQGCDAANTNFCTAGDGDSLVEHTPGSIGNLVTLYMPVTGNEPGQFWKHLALADLITGVNPAADPTPDSVDEAWGETHPASSLRGGIEVFYMGASTVAFTGGSITSGHLLRLSNIGLSASGSILENIGSGFGASNSTQAANLDRKIDDGKPLSGLFQANVVNIGTQCTDWRTNEYDETTQSKDCVLSYYID